MSPSQTKEWREKKRQEIEKRKAEIEARKKFVSDNIEKHKKQGVSMKRINATDTDSRMMQMKRKDFWNGYSPQIATENQIILASTVPNSAGDTQELIPVLKRIQELHVQQPKQVLADKGYASESNYEYLKQNWIDGYIPHPRLQGKQSGGLTWWIYSETKDEYMDPDGNKYSFKQYSHRECQEGEKRKGRWRPTLAEPTKESNFSSKVYQAKMSDGKNRFLSVSQWWMDHCHKQDRKLATPEWRSLYQKRCHDVEPVFGNIKRNLKFERFSLRWFQWVQIEWNLITIAHNLKKIMGSMRNIPA